MEAARSIAAALLVLALAAVPAFAGSDPAPRIIAQANQPACPPGGYGVASCPSYGSKSERDAAKEPDANPPPQYDSRDDCLKAGWGVTQCEGFDKWWKKGESVEMPPNPEQHQGCAGYGVTECPAGGGAGGKGK